MNALGDFAGDSSSTTPIYRRSDARIDERVTDLLGRMTLEEKVDQLHQCGIGDANPNNLAASADRLRPTYGSFIVGAGEGLLETRNALQRRALEETRLGIPALFAADVIHGYRTIMPIPLAQACAWDPALVEQACAIAAAEAHAHGVNWTFAPMVDHCVDPRWGRIAETFGESPHHASALTVASVRGYQGERPGTSGSIAACLKHFVGYGASEGGRDYSYTEVAPQALWEKHLPPFAAGVQAGARTIMAAFNDLNGVPATANNHTLRCILRARWGFDSVVVSDWNSILQLVRQGHAEDGADAARRALDAGVDIDMADGLYREHLPRLLAAGQIAGAQIDDAVRRVLRLKFELGLFDLPFAVRTQRTDAPPASDAQTIAEELAARSIVLLQNDGTLPLAAEMRRVALVGPLATATGALLGSWAQQGHANETPSIADELRQRLPRGTELRVEPACSIDGTGSATFDAALAAAGAADVVILCLGESADMSGENASRSTLRLAGEQEALARAILDTGKPVVLVVVSGRPLEIQPFLAATSAVVAAWQGGTRAAAALADILVGRRNPSGKLAITWPRSVGQIPIYHNMRPRARAGEEGGYRDAPTAPSFEFGHGLSYSDFEHGPIRLSSDHVHKASALIAEMTVRNSSARAGRETVLWFVRDSVAAITRPWRDLKHFESATLAPGESRDFRFEILPARDLGYPDADGQPQLETGMIELHAGGHTAHFRVTE